MLINSEINRSIDEKEKEKKISYCFHLSPFDPFSKTDNARLEKKNYIRFCKYMKFAKPKTKETEGGGASTKIKDVYTD